MRPATSLSLNGDGAFEDDAQSLLDLPTDLQDEYVRARIFLDALLEAIPAAVYFKDRHSRIIEASRRCVEGFGLQERAEVIGKSDFDVLPDAAEKTAAEEREIIRSGLPILDMPENYRLEDGTEIKSLTRKLPLRDFDGEIVGTFGITQEVLRRPPGDDAIERLTSLVAVQRAAAGTAEVESVMALVCERTEELTPANAAAVLLVDEQDFRVTVATSALAGAVSRRFRAESTLARDVLTTAEALSCRDSAENDALDCLLAAEFGMRSFIVVPLLRGETPVGALVAFSEFNNAFRDEDARTLDLLAVVLSAAMSRAAEWEAKQGELEALARFRTMFESAPIGMVKSDADGRMVDANPAAERLLGYTAAELAQRRFTEITHPDDLETNVRLYRELFDGLRATYRLEKRYVRKDGEIVWARVTTAIDRTDGALFAVNMIEDVTESRRAEEHLRQAQKIDAIGQLAAGIAHDFNNLLMGVLGYAGLARAELEAGSRAAEFIERIEYTSERAASLTRQLLAFGRRQTLELADVDLNQLLTETISMLRRVIGEQVTIETHLDPDLRRLEADPTQLQQVLLNLALNARDAMPAGGNLTIETANVAVDESATPPCPQMGPGSYVLLSVSDSGHGMPVEVRERIFEPFFTTKDIGEGTGLGLASVHGIVKQSLGEIAVESAPGAGATFRIYLPAIG